MGYLVLVHLKIDRKTVKKNKLSPFKVWFMDYLVLVHLKVDRKTFKKNKLSPFKVDSGII